MNLPLRSLALLAGALGMRSAAGVQGAEEWTVFFGIEANDLSSTGRNPYFVLEPGYQLVLEDGAERLVISVLAETRVVNGVETRVVEEREAKGGALVEVSRNYFAISRRTNSVFYFGEDVDMYERGTVASHEGAWLAGANQARFGLMMPGLPLLGARYYQEIAPRVAMERAQIVGLNGRLTTAAGSFTAVFRVEETTPLEPGHTEYKLYAPGVGLIQDGSLKLVRFGRPDAKP
jgi:hypothetical protein